MTDPMQRLDDDFARMFTKTPVPMSPLNEALMMHGLSCPPRAPEPMRKPEPPVPEWPKTGGREL